MNRFCVATLALVALVAGCSRSAPVSAPTPAPAPPPAPVPVAPRELAIAHRAGRSVYDYAATATVTLEGDTSRTGERVATTAGFTLAVTGAEPTLRATIIVDSFVVAGGARVGPSERLRAPVRFAATIDARDGRIRIDDPLPPDCASPSTAARLAARSVLVSMPPTLVVGTTWSDSSTTETCRGGLLIRSRVEARYTVESLDARAEPSATSGAVGASASDLVRLARRSSATLTGAPAVGTQGPTMTGTSTGSATLLVNPRTGRLVSLDNDATTQLTISAGTSTRKLVQQVTERVRAR